MKNDPTTPTEWQEAVDLAEFYVCLDSAAKYGLVTGGPQINLERCEQILRDGRALGYRPSVNCVERILKAHLQRMH